MIEVTVKEIDGVCNQPMLVGDSFKIKNGKIYSNDGICIWALQSMMPIFPTLERKEDLKEEDWVKDIECFQCPDPDGAVKYKIEVKEEKKDD